MTEIAPFNVIFLSVFGLLTPLFIFVKTEDEIKVNSFILSVRSVYFFHKLFLIK